MARGKKASPAGVAQVGLRQQLSHFKQSEATSWTKTTGNGDQSSKITVSSERTEAANLFKTFAKAVKLSQSSSEDAGARSDRTAEYRIQTDCAVAAQQNPSALVSGVTRRDRFPIQDPAVVVSSDPSSTNCQRSINPATTAYLPAANLNRIIYDQKASDQEEQSNFTAANPAP